jgi:membrane protease YdiL (CAAX protease family)
MRDAVPQRSGTGDTGAGRAAPDPGPDTVPSPRSSAMWPLAALGIWLAAQVVPILLVSPFLGDAGDAGAGGSTAVVSPAVIWIRQLTSWTLIVVLVWWVNRLLGGTARDLGLARVPGHRVTGDFAVGVGFGLLAVPGTILVTQLLNLVGLGGDTLAPYRTILSEPWGAVFLTVGAVLFAPVAEELFYRGFIQGRAVGARTGRATVVPIVLVAVVFSVVHLNPAAALQLFLFGCLLGWLRQWRGTLAAPVGAHMALNATTMTVILTGLAD